MRQAVVRQVVNRKEVAVRAGGLTLESGRAEVLAPKSVAKFDVSGGAVAWVCGNA